jgi:putative Holliday junction resolvase
MNGAILALDVGKRRIGMAICDQSRSVVRGLATLHRKRIREDLVKLRKVAGEWQVSTLLVGRPLHMSGDASQQSAYTDEFAERLSTHCQLPVVFWDERLSSAHAERLLRESGTPFERSDGTVDRVAAVLLLESYLDYLRMSSVSALEEQPRE